MSLNFWRLVTKDHSNENISKHDVNISGVMQKHQGIQTYYIAITILNVSFYLNFLLFEP